MTSKQVNRNMKDKKLLVQDGVVKRVSNDGRKAKAIADAAAPGTRINRDNLAKEPYSKNVIDTRTLSKSQKSQMDTEARINQYVKGSVNKVRKFDRTDSY